jgi:hypothetical protein
VKKEKPPSKADEYSAFKNLLSKLAKVPKAEADEKEAEYQRSRGKSKKAGDIPA